MDRAVLIIAAAVLVGLGSVIFVGQRTRLASDVVDGRYQSQVIVRDVAKSGFDRGLSAIRRDGMEVHRTWDSVSVPGGKYGLQIDDVMYGDLTIRSTGQSSNMLHEIKSNVIFETPAPGAVVLSGSDIQAVAGGAGYKISGVDKRAPSRALGNGFLRPAYGIVVNSPTNAANLNAAFAADRVVGGDGDASVNVGVNTGAYEAIYTAAVANPSLQTLVAPFAGSYGTPAAPAILRVAGDFSATSNFTGHGLLIVEDGDFVSGPSFNWEGLVLVRKENQPELTIDVSGDSRIYGGLVGYEASNVAGNCTDVPFTIEGLEAVPEVAFNARFDVLGAAISAGGSYDMPVTASLHIGDGYVTPWGSYDLALDGNLNTGEQYVYEPSGTYAPGTGLTISGRSWKKGSGDGTSESDWSISMEQNSQTGGQQLIVLRNGDDVPNMAGYLDQTSVEGFVAEYIDETGKVKLAENQAIYLFELGATDQSSAAFDMQDLVVVATFVRADNGCTFAGPATGPITFALSGGAQVNYSGEAIGKLGTHFPTIDVANRAVIATQRETLLTPEQQPADGGF